MSTGADAGSGIPGARKRASPPRHGIDRNCQSRAHGLIPARLSPPAWRTIVGAPFPYLRAKSAPAAFPHPFFTARGPCGSAPFVCRKMRANDFATTFFRRMER